MVLTWIILWLGGSNHGHINNSENQEEWAEFSSTFGKQISLTAKRVFGLWTFRNRLNSNYYGIDNLLNPLHSLSKLKTKVVLWCSAVNQTWIFSLGFKKVLLPTLRVLLPNVTCINRMRLNLVQKESFTLWSDKKEVGTHALESLCLKRGGQGCFIGFWAEAVEFSRRRHSCAA